MPNDKTLLLMVPKLRSVNKIMNTVVLINGLHFWQVINKIIIINCRLPHTL